MNEENYWKIEAEALHVFNQNQRDHVKMARGEAKFYRDLLEQISSAKRKTMAQRLAASGLLFWDSITKEKTK